MNNKKNKCPSCGQYKYVSMRAFYMTLGLVLLGVSIWLLIIPPIGIAGVVIGAAIFAGGVVTSGRICTNCKYSSLQAHA